MPKHATVAVALSGGVDSAVVALLLKNQGYEVFGVHLVLADTSPPGQHLASLASSLNISLTTLDLRPEFGEKVVQYFVRSILCAPMARGRLPIPASGATRSSNSACCGKK